MLTLLFVLHFIADFPLQSREMGQKKSSELSWLGKHLEIQFVVSMAVLTITFLLGYSSMTLLIYPVLNTLVHGIIDWNIWKAYKWSVYYRLSKQDSGYSIELRGREWKYWEDHLFYTTIGFDQLLHGLTIIFLYQWLA